MAVDNLESRFHAEMTKHVGTAGYGGARTADSARHAWSRRRVITCWWERPTGSQPARRAVTSV